MDLPWKAGLPQTGEEYGKLRREAIFRYHKWDQQVADVETFCSFPLVLRLSAWRELTQLAEALARETQELEEKLLSRPDLWAQLGLPSEVLRAMRDHKPVSRGKARLIRFDFHFTNEGWKISEANTDVPGGWNEATGYAELMSQKYPGHMTAGRFCDTYAAALTSGIRDGARIALIHATAYSDDHQAMVLLSEHLERRGLRTVLASPENITWRKGHAHVGAKGHEELIELIVRYFPGEWIARLRGDASIPFFRGSFTLISNPATALLTQSKRCPLIWSLLGISLKTWSALLPACAEPSEVAWETDPSWIIKPALGRVGADIGMREDIPRRHWENIRQRARRHPDQWIAQRKFIALPLATAEGDRYPCVGVYTIDGKVAGAYGRLATTPVVNHLAQDAAILISESDDI
jgi:glutathionylspermidine synthase